MLSFRFKELFEESKINLAKLEVLYKFLGPDSSVELFEEGIRLEEIQYELYSEMLKEVEGIEEAEIRTMLIVISQAQKELAGKIRETKQIVEQLKDDLA
jgi:hypothetical protein